MYNKKISVKKLLNETNKQTTWISHDKCYLIKKYENKDGHISKTELI